MKTIAAGQFKARCLRLMDEVRATREPVLITKKGPARGQAGACRKAGRRTFSAAEETRSRSWATSSRRSCRWKTGTPCVDHSRYSRSGLAGGATGKAVPGGCFCDSKGRQVRTGWPSRILRFGSWHRLSRVGRLQSLGTVENTRAKSAGSFRGHGQTHHTGNCRPGHSISQRLSRTIRWTD